MIIILLVVAVFDAVLPKTPTRAPQSPRSNHPFSRRISTVSMCQKPTGYKREKSPSKDNKSGLFPILGVPVIPQIPGRFFSILIECLIIQHILGFLILGVLSHSSSKYAYLDTSNIYLAKLHDLCIAL